MNRLSPVQIRGYSDARAMSGNSVVLMAHHDTIETNVALIMPLVRSPIIAEEDLWQEAALAILESGHGGISYASTVDVLSRNAMLRLLRADRQCPSAIFSEEKIAYYRACLGRLAGQVDPQELASSLLANWEELFTKRLPEDYSCESAEVQALRHMDAEALLLLCRRELQPNDCWILEHFYGLGGVQQLSLAQIIDSIEQRQGQRWTEARVYYRIHSSVRRLRSPGVMGALQEIAGIQKNEIDQ